MVWWLAFYGREIARATPIVDLVAWANTTISQEMLKSTRIATYSGFYDQKVSKACHSIMWFLVCSQSINVAFDFACPFIAFLVRSKLLAPC